MTILKKYRDYLRDNPQGYWFKRKLYGWGWTPARWQGWAVIGVSVLYLVWAVQGLLKYKEAQVEVPNGEVFLYVIKIALTIIFIISMCYWKGESPRWQWGIQKDI